MKFALILFLLFYTTVLCDAVLLQDKLHRYIVNRHEGNDEEMAVSKRGDCSYHVLWQTQGEEINFSLTTTVASLQTSLWIAVGLSETQDMPDTKFVSCWSISNQTVQVKSGLTEDHNGITITDTNQSNVSLLRGEWKDNELYCNFSWKPSRKNFKYLILATGLLSDEKENPMMKHTSQPSVSPWQHKDSGSGELTINCDCNSTWGVTIIRIHGALMGLAFLLLFPIGMVTARYYRSTFQPTQWFKVHSRLMVMAVCSVILALVLALVHTNGTLHVGIHQILGIVVIIAVLLQPLVALCRPHADPLTVRRRVFNIFHRTLGISIFIGGVVQCFLGVYILTVQSKGMLYGFLIFFVIGHGIFIVLYEFIHFRLSRRVLIAHYSKMIMEDDNSDGEEVIFMDTAPSSRPPPQKSPMTLNPSQSSQHMNTIYYIYILQGFTVTGLFNAFLFYEI